VSDWSSDVCSSDLTDDNTKHLVSTRPDSANQGLFGPLTGFSVVVEQGDIRECSAKGTKGNALERHKPRHRFDGGRIAPLNTGVAGNAQSSPSAPFARSSLSRGGPECK